jgi:phosphodiesterase/alkaline phosphatase D-like protein
MACNARRPPGTCLLSRSSWHRSISSGARRTGFYVDGWDGYVAQRNRLLRFIERRKIANPVVLTGDWHANWLAELNADFTDPSSATLATEFVETSISSTDVLGALPEYGKIVLRESPHIEYFNNERVRALRGEPGVLENRLQGRLDREASAGISIHRGLVRDRRVAAGHE